MLGTTEKLRTSSGGILEQRIFALSAIAVADPALINEVNDETHWQKHVGPLVDKMRLTLGDGLFTAYNDEPNWRKAHNILMPAFTKAAMTNYHERMTATVRELLQAWNTRSADQAWIDIPDQANRLTVEVIGRAGLGYSFGTLSDATENAFSTAFTRALGYARRAMRVDPIPLWTQLFGKKRHQQHLADQTLIRQLVGEVVAARSASPATPQRHDMLDVMLHSADPETGEQLDGDNIINQILTLMLAGSETSANTISFALHYLATNPDMAAQARAEIDQRWPGTDFPDIEFEDIAKLRYLRRVVDETLRLWPVAPATTVKPDTTRPLAVANTPSGKEIGWRSSCWPHTAPPHGPRRRHLQPRPVPTRQPAHPSSTHLQAVWHRAPSLPRPPIRAARDRVDTGGDPAPIRPRTQARLSAQDRGNPDPQTRRLPTASPPAPPRGHRPACRHQRRRP
ncbi:cytochrome P450 family protein [Mycobacterium kansasii]|uniref:Cytochrome P450 family protein n=1 Tax=Mycobacterium kansasii TaxID=1768 RepID=A0A1V3WE16_MYCKA|nr:cytochrome P450 family protein [Mycobacterium kansasii]